MRFVKLIVVFSLFTGLKSGSDVYASLNQNFNCKEAHDSLYNLADEYYYIDIKKSLAYSYELLDLAKLCNEDAIYLSAYQSLGWAYLSTSDFPEAVRNGEKALDLALKSGDAQELIITYNLLGNIYIELPDREYALDYFEKGIAVALSVQDDAYLATLYNNVAIVHEMFEDRKLALNYYHKAREMFEKTDVAIDKGLIYLNIGDTYFYLEDYDSATYYFHLSRQFMSAEEDPSLLSLLYLCMSTDESHQGNFDAAVQYLDSSYVLLSDASSPTDYIEFFKEKSEIFFKHGQYKDAYIALEQAYTLKDSVLSNDVSKKLREVQISTLAERKEAEIKDLQQTNEMQNLILSENKATQKTYLLTIILSGIIFSFLLFVLINHRRTHKKLTLRSKIIEDQSLELNKKNILLQEINKEILDSISYAKRIQNAILPSKKSIQKLLPEAFILYKPKDIVAGDFYWLESSSNLILIAAGDCTGHGVPGAMVSVVCNNGLNRSVREHKITDPAKILEKTREIVIQEFEKSDEQVQDGMDISLCAFSPSDYSLKWAGANNPIWIISKGQIKADQLISDAGNLVTCNFVEDENYTFIEIKGDKQPIGKYANAAPFKTHNIQLQKGDLVYLPTDGFQDQFGGDKGKKFKASALKTLLGSIRNQPMNKQHEILEATLEDWRGNLEQVDDVCMVGIKF